MRSLGGVSRPQDREASRTLYRPPICVTHCITLSRVPAIFPTRPLDTPAPAANCDAVSRLTKFAALLLVALWLPATLHCQLEGLGLDAIFACADQPADTAHTDGDTCADDGCQTLEEGQFALSKSRIDPAILPVPACACGSCFIPVVPAVPASEISAIGQEMILPLQRTWQFARRAALPARAPDTLSV